MRPTMRPASAIANKVRIVLPRCVWPYDPDHVHLFHHAQRQSSAAPTRAQRVAGICAEGAYVGCSDGLAGPLFGLRTTKAPVEVTQPGENRKTCRAKNEVR